MTNTNKIKLIDKIAFVVNFLISCICFYACQLNTHVTLLFTITIVLTFFFSACMFCTMTQIFSEQNGNLRNVTVYNLAIVFINFILILCCYLFTNPYNIDWNNLFEFELFHLLLSFIISEILISLLYSCSTKVLIIINENTVLRFVNKLMKDFYLYGETQTFILTDDNLEECYKKIDTADGILLLSEINEELKAKCINYALKHNKSISLIPSYDKVCYMHSATGSIGDTPIISFSAQNPLKIEMGIKRLFDIIFSLALLILTFPIFIILSIAIKLTSPGPVFYKQERYTINKKVFNVYKFRSMKTDAEKNGAVYAAKDDERITSIGKFMRATRLDELPQLLNIIKGDMSVVGCRPERPIFSDEYSKKIKNYDVRFEMKAGLTGYAQVCGKYNTRISDKQLFDILYVRNFSLLLDFKILLRTLFVVLSKEATEGVDNTDEIVKELSKNNPEFSNKIVSIIIPSYNSAKYLNQCIDSVLKQPCNKEIILVNDGSTDNTDEITKQYKDSIIYVKTENHGQSAARNEGLMHATGDYIMFLDSDDYLKENAIAELLNIALNSKVDIVHYGYCNFADGSDFVKYPKEIFITGEKVEKDQFRSCVYPHFINGINLCSVCFEMYKAELLKDIRFDNSLITAEDGTFNLAAYTKAQSLIAIPNTYYFYRQTKTGLTGSSVSVRDKYKFNIRFGKVIEKEYLNKWGMNTKKWKRKTKLRIVKLTLDKLNRLRIF